MRAVTFEASECLTIMRAIYVTSLLRESQGIPELWRRDGLFSKGCGERKGLGLIPTAKEKK